MRACGVEVDLVAQVLQLVPLGRRQYLVHDLALTRDLGQSFQRAQMS